ncbi:hypothetical protein GQX73_g10095 [Xylaria multiplex]|uniref:Uncharacterized protein n=1 Tax=Xylaria multiplex TaxID=323545 RepID=A0A7C8IHB8_9PEZI|nr:hypothetical protein GQX73_g10095 [Xylaria multiplex]
MNWTEGSLARHSRGRQRNVLIARQKQHFAKARSNLLNGAYKAAPVSISFLQSKSASQSPRRVLSHRDYNHTSSTPPSPLVDRDPPREYPTYQRDDDYDTLPPDLDRRRRLLEKPDWAGLRLQEPLDISFPGQIYATRRWTRASIHPRERAPGELRNYAAAHEEKRYKRLKRSSMRIQIGSQEIQPSIATASQLGIKPRAFDLENLASAHWNHSMSDDNWDLPPPKRELYDFESLDFDSSSRISTTSLGKPEVPVNVRYASAVIHQPAPCRTTNFQVPKWVSSSSEDGRSMQVEIEEPVRPVSPSQESEQQKWKDWVLYEESLNVPSCSPTIRLGTSQISTKGSEGSAVTLPSHLQPQLPMLRLSSELEPEQEHTLRHSPKSTDEEETTRNDSSFQDDQHPPDNHNLLPPNRQCISPKKLDVPDDLNEIWRKFAYGDDENSEELLKDAFKEAAHQAAVELRPSKTPSSVDGYTETAATCGTELCSIDQRCQDDPISSDLFSVSNMAMKGTTASETASSNIATIASSDEPPHNPKWFTLPKAFVGKHANTDPASIAKAIVTNIPRSGKKGRGKRRKKMATDGRTDIRSLPDFDGDPIEEIEDDSYP